MQTKAPVGADEVWVEDSGGAGEAVLLIHPGIHDATVWEPVLPLLDGFRTVRYDARGFGRSAHATEAFAYGADVVRVLDHLGIERAHLVGNSQGGKAALSTVLEHPERVRSLTLLAPGIEGYPWPDDDPALEAEYAAASEAGDRAAILGLWERIWCACGTDEALRAQLAAAYDADQAQGSHELDEPEQWSRLGGVTVPTTVVIGERDIASMVTGSTDLAAAIPGAELVRLAGVDHLPSLRAPEAVAEVVRRTVARAS